jgi:hypothetical protein
LYWHLGSSDGIHNQWLEPLQSPHEATGFDQTLYVKPKMLKRHLENVTLCCIDTNHPMAGLQSVKACKFNDLHRQGEQDLNSVFIFT